MVFKCKTKLTTIANGRYFQKIDLTEKRFFKGDTYWKVQFPFACQLILRAYNAARMTTTIKRALNILSYCLSKIIPVASFEHYRTLFWPVSNRNIVLLVIFYMEKVLFSISTGNPLPAIRHTASHTGNICVAGFY